MDSRRRFLTDFLSNGELDAIMNWPNTLLTERLGIRYPIIQAPMDGGPGSPELVATVANAGGLGTLAGGSMPPARLRAVIAEVRALTDRPFAVNLAAASPGRIDPARIARACELLAPTALNWDCRQSRRNHQSHWTLMNSWMSFWKVRFRC